MSTPVRFGPVGPGVIAQSDAQAFEAGAAAGFVAEAGLRPDST